MRRILHISKYYYPFVGGIEQTARDCIMSLADLYEQKVICYNHEPGESVEVIDGIEVIRCDCLVKIASQPISLPYGNKIKKVIKEFKPDMVLFHYPNPYAAHWMLKYIPNNTELLIYWHLDIVRQKILGKFFAGQNNRLVSRAVAVIATSPNYVDGSRYLNRAREKCVVVPSCIRTERFTLTRENKELSDRIKSGYPGKILCLAVGRHTEYKGFKYLIEAGKYLDERFEILIAGEGELTERLKELAQNDKKVHFLGLISDNELKAYLEAADMLCFPSVTRNEAFGLALAEGLYMGKPAVTFTIEGSGVNYVSIDNVTGIEVPNRNVKAYAEAMIKLADHPKLREEYGRNGKERVKANFLYDQFRQNIRMAVQQVEGRIGDKSGRKT